MYNESMYNTQNQPASQLCTACLTTKDLSNHQIGDHADFPYKKGRSTCFPLFDFLILSV